MKIKSSLSMLKSMLKTKLKSVLKQSVLIGFFVFSLFVGVTAGAQDLLKGSYPDSYTVKKGDTLWDISGVFLNKPWRWPEIWQANDQIENPHLIFPGDILVLTFIDGRPVLRRLGEEIITPAGASETVKLQPSIRESSLDKAIPAISPGAILPFLKAPLVTDQDELSTAPYIVEGVEKRLIAGMYDDMYIRGLNTDVDKTFRVFRGGRQFVHPATGELLGYEAKHIGNARLKKFGDTSRVGISMSHREIAILDRLRPYQETKSLPYFYPRAHASQGLSGYVLQSYIGNLEFGKLDVVALSLGTREGVEAGHVFKIVTGAEQRIDPLTKQPYLLPSEQAGLVMVVRAFDKVSYALIMDRDRVIEAGDKIVHPDAVTPTYDSEHPVNSRRIKMEKEGNKLQKWWYKQRYGKYGETPDSTGSVDYQRQ